MTQRKATSDTTLHVDLVHKYAGAVGGLKVRSLSGKPSVLDMGIH